MAVLSSTVAEISCLPAELRYADELARLATLDSGPRPEGWRLTPRMVRTFIVGSEDLGIDRKFYGDDPLVDRAIVTLMGNQALLLVGPPGTAKSMLSELLAAAISNDSMLAVQGAAGTSDDHFRYSWNYALLIAEGPSERSLLRSPILEAMQKGQIVRIEEITRCPIETQDVLISTLSEKQMIIPELGEKGRVLAKRGFNVIGTANLKDRGVNEMSSALKRRFNFEHVRPIRSLAQETELVTLRVNEELALRSLPEMVNRDVVEVLTTTFLELRSGRTLDGRPISAASAVLSTAEAVNVCLATCLHAAYFGDGTMTAGALAEQLDGAVSKDNEDDASALASYVETVVRERSRLGGNWKSFYTACRARWVKGA